RPRLEFGAVYDALGGDDDVACRLHHQDILEARADDAAVPFAVGLLDVDDRNVGNERGNRDDGLTGVGIDDGLETTATRHIRTLHPRDRHEGNTLDRGAQSGDDAVAGVFLDLHIAALNGAPVARRHPEDRFEPDEPDRGTHHTAGPGEKVDVVGAGGFD